MPRLFIDVDDTLVLWHNPILTDDDWDANETLIKFVREWKLFHRAGEVIVWSLGGADYAAMWKHRLLPEADRSEAKYPIIPQVGDLFIDDDPLGSYRNATLHPHMLALKNN